MSGKLTRVIKKPLDAQPTCGKIFVRMDSRAIEKLLIETLHEVQVLGGHAPARIDLQTCPIKDLDQFDSLTGVETTILLSMKLKCEFKSKKGEVNVFVSKDARRALTVKEIADRLVELCE
jgi:hypothetical protein